MNFDLLYLVPIIGAIIGWLTNYIAVKMLFRPRRKINLLGLKVQGVFPKRQIALSKKVGQLVSTELLDKQDLKNTFQESIQNLDLEELISKEIDNIILNRLPVILPMASMILNNEVSETIKTLIAQELKGSVENTINGLSDDFIDKIQVQETVQNKIQNFSSEKLEQLVIEVMKREFKFIEIIGAAIGFLIGLTQLALVKLV